MITQLSARGVSTAQSLSLALERKVHYALDRFERWITRVNLSLTDQNGERGGNNDKVCRVVLTLPRHAPIVVEERGPSVWAAASNAIERAAYSVSRLSARRKQRRTRAGHSVAGLDSAEHE